VYVLLKLRPQFPSNQLVEEVSGWSEVEHADEVYGDVDVILLTRRIDSNGVEILDRIRNRFKDAIVNTETLPVE
jgi:DNA-binding Lrp family transcriptional regulator